MKEMKILRQVNHKNIIATQDIYENENYVFFVQELLKGGELMNKLKTIGSYSEYFAA